MDEWMAAVRGGANGQLFRQQLPRIHFPILRQSIPLQPNCPLSICPFSLGQHLLSRAEDAPYIVQEFNQRLGKLDLLQLPSFRIYVKLMVDGTPLKPFSAATMRGGNFR